MPEFDFSNAPWIVTLIAFLFLIFKEPLARSFPSLFGWLSTSARIKELQAEGERQDDVAIISGLLALQRDIVKQNQDMFNYIKDRLDKRLEGQSGLINRRFDAFERKIEQLVEELNDIDKRWMVAGRETEGVKNRLQILAGEITRMGDDFSNLKEIVDRAMKNG
jgi:hypothetical protein